jgi:cytochrome b561
VTGETAYAARAAGPISQGSSRQRYVRAAIILHWTIAMLILTQIGIGWYMNEALPDHSPAQAQVKGIHVSLGLTILLLVLARIGVRLFNPPPPLPAGMPAWERLLSGAVHLLFYVLMLVMPLTGWFLVSLGNRPISFWGLPWPHLPGAVQLIGSAPPRAARETVAHVHVFILIWIVLINLALHVAGALKHQFDGRPVLWRMTGLAPPDTDGKP